MRILLRDQNFSRFYHWCLKCLSLCYSLVNLFSRLLFSYSVLHSLVNIFLASFSYSSAKAPWMWIFISFMFDYRGVLKKSNDSKRLIFSAIFGIAFGFLIGITFPNAFMTRVYIYILSIFIFLYIYLFFFFFSFFFINATLRVLSAYSLSCFWLIYFWLI